MEMKHPAALGTDIRITMAEAWGMLGPLIAVGRAAARWGPAFCRPPLLVSALPLSYGHKGYPEKE